VGDLARAEQKATVLVVDDDKAVLRLHSLALSKHGYQVETASSGVDALRVLEQKPCDVIISDIDMPGRNGIQLLTDVRSKDLDVPVILVTGAPSLDSAVRAVELGAMRYLLKPVGILVLVKVVEEAVRRHRAAKAKRQRGLMLGSTVDGRYELKRDLGKGAAGFVFEATHAFSGRSVALKVLSPDVPGTKLEELRVRMVREARALAAVKHPGVVEVLDGGVLEDGTPYVVMERLDGRTLEGLLTTRGKLSQETVIGIALQVCSALQAVHGAGIVHRDLKPNNLLIALEPGGDERVKLVDFGVAQLGGRTEQKLTEHGTVVGTPEYMAPEQLLASDDVDHRADIYALGVTMFECLVGAVPYPGNYPKVLMQVAGDGPVPSLPPEMGAPLVGIVARAMAKNREDRFASAKDFAAALRGAFPNAVERTMLLEPPAVATRRQFDRAPYATPVDIFVSDGMLEGRSEDISEGGMLVICRDASTRDELASARFALPIDDAQVVHCKVRLRWLRPDEPEVAGPRALGLEFVDPPDVLRDAVRRYVERTR
jgi:serine/threonine protein kinase/CheY-like chemotaxis protein